MRDAEEGGFDQRADPVHRCRDGGHYLSERNLVGSDLCGDVDEGKAAPQLAPLLGRVHALGLAPLLWLLTQQMAAFMPYAPFAIAAGFVFGVWQGVLIQTAATIIAAAALFASCRALASTSLDRWLAENKLATRIRERVSETWTGVQLNLLCCFLPITFSMHVYGFSMTKLPIAYFVVSLAVGLIPLTVLYCLAGHAMRRIGEGGIGTYEAISLCVGVCATLGVVIYLTLMTRRWMKEAESDGGEKKETSPLLAGEAQAPTKGE